MGLLIYIDVLIYIDDKYTIIKLRWGKNIYIC